jgi:hypothetical protein
MRFGRASDTVSAALWAWLLLSALTLGYALAIYAHIPAVKIVGTYGFYQLIFAFLVWLLILERKPLLPVLTIWTSLSALCLVGVAVYVFTSYVDTVLSFYVKNYPTIELDAGGGWHPDTAFHVSLIKSISSLGYPSISLHGTPLTAYHVLTHYVDAAIASLAGLDAFESYGLLTLVKTSLFLSAVLLSFSKLVERHSQAVLLGVAILGLPVVVGTWHPVLSHGLWMPCLVLALGMPFVVSCLYRRELPAWPQVLGLIVICIACGLGKVSTGFMLACLIGCWLAVKGPFATKTVVFGAATVLFFYLYGYLFIKELNQIQAGLSSTGVEGAALLDFYTKPQLSRAGVTVESWAPYLGLLWCLLTVFAVIRASASAGQLLIAASGAMLILWGVTAVYQGLSVSDVMYFIHGLSFPLLFIAIAVIAEIFGLFMAEAQSPALRRGPLMLLMASTLLFVVQLNASSYTIFNWRESAPKAWRVLVAEPFAGVNKFLPPASQLSLFDSRAAKRAKLSLLNGSVASFRQSLLQSMQARGVSSDESALFLPREVFEQELVSLKGHIWAHGILAYALWGVPLVHGAPAKPFGYGLAAYATTGKFISRDQFDIRLACEVSKAKVIWIADRFSPPQIQARECRP